MTANKEQRNCLQEVPKHNAAQFGVKNNTISLYVFILINSVLPDLLNNIGGQSDDTSGSLL